MLLKKNTAPSVDLEPEYIAASGGYAYVALQEANAIAVLDIAEKQFLSVNGLDFKDHSLEGNGLDMIKDGSVSVETQEVYGVYMPDGLDTFEQGGKTYIVTANEGDAREWGDYADVQDADVSYGGETYEIETLVNAEFDGLDETATYLLGGRSFSVIDAETMEIVYDSGDLIERTIAASEYADHFNCSNDDVELDSRSKKKGAEPENVKVAAVNGRTFVFVGLERQGGVMAFDVSDLSDVQYVAWANSRDYSADMAGDVAPEGLDFIPAAESPNGQDLLVVSNENSGTVALYALEGEKKTYAMHETAEFIPVEKADHLLIWSVFGNGGNADGQTSNDFIAVCNPTDEAIDLSGYTVRYSTMNDATDRIWTDIDMEGVLPAGGTYVIIGEDTGNEKPLISFAADEYNQKADGLEIDNKQYTVEITDADGNVVDRLGVDNGDENELCEGAFVTDISKNKIVTRTNAADTDNNAADFTVVKLESKEDAAAYKPVAAVLG